MAKRAGISFRGRVQFIRAALSRSFNPSYVSNLSAWRAIFGGSINEWGVYGEAFDTHPLVHRAITVIHNSAAGVPITLSREQGADMKLVTSGVEWAALNRPSASMSRAALIGSTAGLMQCDMGEAFWVIVKAGDARAIVLINPEVVEVIREARTGFLRYRITLDGGEQRVLEERDVIHFKTFNPINPLRGSGPLRSAKATVTDDLDIRQHNRQMVRNGGPYGPVLKADGPLPEKGSAEDSALEAQLEKMLGTPGARFKAILLPDAMDFADKTRTRIDMDFLESRKQNVKEIAGAFGVPPSKLGDYERDQADSEAQERDYWNDTMVPILRYIADKIETDMWKITGLAKSADVGINVGFDFDTVPVLVRQKQSLWAGDTQDVQAGIQTINEVRRRRGLPDVAWGNVWWSFGMPVPITSGEAPEVPGLLEPDPETEDDETADDGDEAPGGKAANVIRLAQPAASILEDRDELVLAGFLLVQARHEGAVARAMRGILADQEAEVMANLRAAYKSIAVPEVRKPANVTELLFDLDAAAAKTGRALRPSLRDAQAAGGKRGLRMARSSATFSVDAKPAIEYLQRQTQRFAKPVSETTWESLRDSLSEGLKRGEGERELAVRVGDVMDLRRADAARIARTEVNAAVNGGVDLGFQQSGVVAKKRWITAGDKNVRDAHRKAHGQTVDVSQLFVVGGEQIGFPGDPRGSVGNVAECRCTIEPILKRG